MKKTLFAVCVQLLTIGQFAFAFNAQEAVKVDRFEDINCEDEMAHLDNFAVELQAQPDAIGYIIFYGGRKYGRKGQTRLPRRNEAEARVARLKSYLIHSRSLDPTRINLLNGGYRETWQAELRIVPNSGKPPILTPTLKPSQVKFRKGTAREKDYYCEV